MYTCEAFNDAGESFSSCTLVVSVAGEQVATPKYTDFPHSATVSSGEPAIFFAELDKVSTKQYKDLLFRLVYYMSMQNKFKKSVYYLQHKKF